MALMDTIIESRSVLPRGDVRVSHRDAMHIRGCSLRYVLDPDASAQCAHLLRDCPDLMTLEREVLRLPADEFWIEWVAEEHHPGAARQKLGCYVRAAEDGRSGTILPYYSTAEGRAQRLPGVIDFDLDSAAPQSTRDKRNFSHRDFAHLEHVLSHASMSMDAGWVSSVAKSGEAALTEKMTHEAEGSWFFLPFLLTFSVLLSSPNILRERRSGMASGHQGTTRSHAPLAHIEVSLHLGEYSDAGSAPGAGSLRGGREMPRLHVVRGHYVSRGDKVFWRTSHLRGAGDWAGFSKIVHVKAASGSR